MRSRDPFVDSKLGVYAILSDGREASFALAS
jgi:hypothetical protein